MSEENVEAVRRFYTYLNRNDWQAIADLTAPGFEWQTAPGIASSRVFRSIGAVRQWWNSEVAESWDLRRSSDEIEEVYDLGSCVVVAVRSRDVGRGSGVVVESRIAALFEVNAGKIQGVRVFRDVDEGLKAAGLLD